MRPGSRQAVPADKLLGRVALFKALDAGTLARLAAGATRVALRRGQVLFRQGDAATGLYVVVYGEVKLIAHTPTRGARLTGIVAPGESFGEPVMFLERPMLVDAQAASDTLLLHLPKEAIFAEIERSPRFARRMIAALARRVERLVGELDRQSVAGGSARLAAFLLRQHGGAGATPFTLTLPASKAEIASLLNLTPEHFSRILHELADAGAIEVQRRRITLRDPVRLHAVAKRR
jgi:CRP-like cAMP-binding protein